MSCFPTMDFFVSVVIIGTNLVRIGSYLFFWIIFSYVEVQTIDFKIGRPSSSTRLTGNWRYSWFLKLKIVIFVILWELHELWLDQRTTEPLAVWPGWGRISFFKEKLRLGSNAQNMSTVLSIRPVVLVVSFNYLLLYYILSED